MDPARGLLSIALDLTAALTASDRYERLLEVVRRSIPCDAASIMKVQADGLVILAAHGLVPEALGHRYSRHENPRLDVILGSLEPVRFTADSSLPDPFDGLIAGDEEADLRVHACLGCPLHASGDVVGVLTADAFDPHSFDEVDQDFLAMLGALAGAALRTSALIESLESSTRHSVLVTRELIRDASLRGGGEIIGTTPVMEMLRREIETVARSDFPVLVLGETGVGKELVARSIHDVSRRSDAPLIHVNCAALPSTMAESELFGHVRGAFTGATQDRAGKFEVAHGGTLLLDEIGELPMEVQPKLLRALQDGEIQRVGSDRTRNVDVRIVAATNRDLDAEVEAGRFRLDLYHRLDVYPIMVPPLRDHSKDIPLLAGHFLDGYRRQLGTGPIRLHGEARNALVSATWPGNVRELQNVLGRAVLRARAGTIGDRPIVIHASHLDVPVETGTAPAGASGDLLAAIDDVSLGEAVEELKRRMIVKAVESSHGNWAEAARRLGMHRSNLHHMARRLGLRDG